MSEGLSGISNIIEMINEKTSAKEKEIIKEAMRHKKLILEEAERRVAEVEKRIISKTEGDTKAEISRCTAGAKLKSKYQILEAKEKMIRKALKRAEDSLEKVVGKAEYKRILNHLAVDGGVALGEDSLDLLLVAGHEKYLDLKAVEREISKLTGDKVKISISKERVRATGGVLVSTADKSKWVDNTFAGRFERMEDSIRNTVASVLFGEVGE